MTSRFLRSWKKSTQPDQVQAEYERLQHLLRDPSTARRGIVSCAD
jgi:hypothetical protein